MIDRFSVELDWLPQGMIAPRVADWVNSQILTEKERRKGGSPARVVVALDFAAYLRAARLEQRVAARIEETECQLAAAYVAASLAESYDDDYAEKIEARIEALRRAKSKAVVEARAESRSSKVSGGNPGESCARNG
jgi:hypothetical protein